MPRAAAASYFDVKIIIAERDFSVHAKN